MSRMRMATPSPISAPTTRPGCVTSWPPRRLGVIIGPQQPGAVFAIMVPPFSTGPSIGPSGSSTLFVKLSTTTLRLAEPFSLLPSVMPDSPDAKFLKDQLTLQRTNDKCGPSKTQLCYPQYRPLGDLSAGIERNRVEVPMTTTSRA